MVAHIQIGDVTPRVQYAADGVQTNFTYPFPVFEDTDLEVYLDAVQQVSGFTIAGAGDSSGGSVTFTVAPTSSVVVTLVRRLAIQRISDFQESGAFRSKIINDELDYLTAALQQVSDDQGRSAQMPITFSANVDMNLPTPQANTTLAWNGAADGFLNGPTIDEVSNAQTYAINASSSAMAATASETNAAGSAASAFASEGNAAASATAAAVSASSGLYKEVVRKTSNYTILPTDDGHLIQVDTTAGNVTITLPDSSGLIADMRVSIAKMDGTVNTVTVQTSGADMINGVSNQVMDVQYEVRSYVLDQPTGTWLGVGGTSLGVFGGAGIDVNGGAISITTSGVIASMLADEAKPYDIAFVAGFDATMIAQDVAVQTYGEVVAPRALVLTGEQLYADVAPSGAAAIFDIEKNGVSVYSTKPQVAALANVGTVGVLSTVSVTAGDRLTFKCTQTGSTTPGGGVRFTLAGKLA